MQPKVLKNRIYRHYKGDYYIVVDIAKNSETDEEMVIYRGLYADGPLWARPLSLFTDKLDSSRHPNVKQKYRFELQDLESQNNSH